MKHFKAISIFTCAALLALRTTTVSATVVQGHTSVADTNIQAGYTIPGVAGTINYAVLAPGDPLFSTLAAGFNPGAGSPSVLASNEYIYLFQVINDATFDIASFTADLAAGIGTLTSIGTLPLYPLSPPSTASGPVPGTMLTPDSWGFFADGYRFTANGLDIAMGLPLQSNDVFGIDTTAHGNRDNSFVGIVSNQFVLSFVSAFNQQPLDIGDPSMIVGFTVPIPEPNTFALVGLGLLGVLSRRRR